MLTLAAIQNSSWNFSLQNYDVVWNSIVQISAVLIALFIGNILRNIIPILKKSLIPSALIGGCLLLGANYLCKAFGFELVNQRFMQVLTYHGLGLGFIAMSLKTTKARTKTGSIKVVETGLLAGGTYMLQALIGLLITIILYASSKVFYALGLILPLGFGQGPGNALAWDINYTSSYPDLFSGNGSVGLSIASFGFIVASVVGVFYINLKRKANEIRKETISNKTIENEIFIEENEIPSSESVDKFSIQVGFVLIAYIISFGFMCLLASLSDFTNSLAWGFNFLWGVFAAMLIKSIIKKLNKIGTLKRNYINNYQMDRISGFTFDMMIVAGVAAIEIKDVMQYILPIVLLCVFGTISSYIYIRIIAKHCFKEFEHEVFVMHFATYTGTASNGMIMLKEIDPNLETPTANLYILSQVFSMISVAPLLLLLGFAGKSFTNAIISLAIFFVLFTGYTIFLLRKSIFKKRNTNK